MWLRNATPLPEQQVKWCIRRFVRSVRVEPDDGGEEPSRTAPSARGAGPQPLVVLEFRRRDLFEEIDPDLWNRSERNPIAFLDLLTINRLKELERDESVPGFA